MSFKEIIGCDCYKFNKRGGIQEITYSKEIAFIRTKWGRGLCGRDIKVRAFSVHSTWDESLVYPNRDSDYIKILTQFL